MEENKGGGQNDDVSGYLIWLSGFAILYFVIETAVKNGINKSILGQVKDEKREY